MTAAFTSIKQKIQREQAEPILGQNRLVANLIGLFTWIVGLSIFVLLEKLLPAGHGFGYLTGVAFIAWGLWLLAAKLAA